MKNTVIKRKKTLIAMMIAVFFFGLFSCNKEIDSIEETSTKNFMNAVVELKYVFSTTTLFKKEKSEVYTEYDYGLMNPDRLFQRVHMQIFETGDVYLEYENLDDKSPIVIPHTNLPDPTPKVHKTVLSNNMARMYNKAGKIIGEYPIEIPNQIEMVRSLYKSAETYSEKTLNYAIATMQGHLFIKELDKYLFDAAKNGIEILYQDDSYVTLRESIKIKGNETKDAVLIIDKVNNRLSACRVYEKDEVLLTTIYGYGSPKNPQLTSIKQIENVKLPSGSKVISEKITQIHKVDLKVNI